MLSRNLFFTLLQILIHSSSVSLVTGTPVQKDVPDSLKPRQSEITPHPLDYAPDFSKDPFPPWPPVTNDDGSNITTENCRGTKLFGWKGCDKSAQKIIVETMKHFQTLANQDALYKNIDWDSPAAKDIWGHATDDKRKIPDNVKTQIKQIFQSTQQIYDKNWWVPPYIYDPPWVAWRNLWIRVQCSPNGDEGNKCGDKPQKPAKCPSGQVPTPRKSNRLEAYSDPMGDYSQITFCNYFFNTLPDLDFVINTAKKNPGSYRNDLWNYQNRARVLFHEMTHLYYFMNSPDKSPYVDDVRIKYGTGKNRVNEFAYGPTFLKILANYKAVGTGGYFTQRNADSYAWFAMVKYVEKQFGIYPSEPVIPPELKPTSAPTAGDGRKFFVEEDAGDTDEASDLSTDNDHFVPGCEDHPIQKTAGFGASTVNESTATECPDTNAPSGVKYNVFYGQEEHPNIYDKFCQNVDGTVNSKLIVDSHGNQRSPATSRLRNKRTPPPDPDAYTTFNFELRWEKNDANQGCGQTVESCRNAFAKLANSPCGHQGGEQNELTVAGKITLPDCGSYSYLITGPDVPKPAEPAPPASSNPPTPPPSTTTSVTTPDMSSKPCQDCMGDQGASDCKADDNQCLVDQCKNNRHCQERRIDCNIYADG